MLKINGAVKSFKKFTLGPIDLELPEGYILGLVGENGSGKTTLIYTIMNLLPPESGIVRIFGQSYKDAEVKIKEDIGFVYEEPVFYLNLKPSAMARILKESYQDWDDREYERLMKKFAIEDKPLESLSKGQRAAFHFLTALCHNARLLILDEPTVGLDPIVRREMLEELRRYVEPGNRSVLISSHITSDLEQVADIISFLHKGEIYFTKDVDFLKENYFIVRGSREDITKMPLLGRVDRATHSEGLYQGSREEIADSFAVDPASLEDILYFMKRGEMS